MNKPPEAQSVRVLFVSLRNSARSLLAEAILGKLAPPQFKVYSCGVPGFRAEHPEPVVMAALERSGFPTAHLRPKSWTQLQQAGSQQMDFVITLAERLPMDMPIWQGGPVHATWAYPVVAGQSLSRDDSAAAVQRALYSLHLRIELFLSLHQRNHSKQTLSDDIRSLGMDQP